MLVVVIEHFLRERLEYNCSGGIEDREVDWEGTGVDKGVLTHPAGMCGIPIVFKRNTPGLSFRNKPDNVPLMPRCTVAIRAQRVRFGKHDAGIWIARHHATRDRLVEFGLARPP